LETEKNGYFGVGGNFDKFEWVNVLWIFVGHAVGKKKHKGTLTKITDLLYDY
jgi:hypothetical protein